MVLITVNTGVQTDDLKATVAVDKTVISLTKMEIVYADIRFDTNRLLF